MSILAGKVVIVTGASRGIGAAAALALGKAGATVVLAARDGKQVAEVAQQIVQAGGKASASVCDVADYASVERLVAETIERFGRLDVLVHCAGVLGKLTPVGHVMPDDWAGAVAVNLDAALRLIRTCDPLLRQAPAGRAVFVTDERARAPKAYWGAYGATKAGMEHLVLTWADEVKTTRLRVNLFDPGPMRTRLRANAFPGENPATVPAPVEVAPALAALCLPAEARHAALITAAGSPS